MSLRISQTVRQLEIQRMCVCFGLCVHACICACPSVCICTWVIVGVLAYTWWRMKDLKPRHGNAWSNMFCWFLKNQLERDSTKKENLLTFYKLYISITFVVFELYADETSELGTMPATMPSFVERLMSTVLSSDHANMRVTPGIAEAAINVLRKVRNSVLISLMLNVLRSVQHAKYRWWMRQTCVLIYVRFDSWTNVFACCTDKTLVR